jgi:hypothetical protein
MVELPMFPEQAVVALFGNMFREELDPYRSEKRNILDPDLKDVGIGFGTGAVEIDGDIEHRYVGIVDFGATVQESPNLLTVVYRDLNGDGLYSPDEGVPEALITVDSGYAFAGFVRSEDLRTNSAGGVAFAAAPGLHRLTLQLPYWVEERSVRVDTENLRVEFRI